MNQITPFIMILLLISALGASTSRQVTPWAMRLEALQPAEPLAYLELAEEIVDASGSARDIDLARRLYGLAGVLDPGSLGRSAALALADLEHSPLNKRRLLALASMLAEQSGQMSLYDRSLGTTEDGQDAFASPNQAALDLVEALSAYRRGDGARALALARRDAVADLMKRYEHLISGGYDRFIEDCRIYRNNDSPRLSEAQVTRMLLLEEAVLAPGERRWVTELALNRGRPLVEIDINRLPQMFGVDASRPYYRDGRWMPIAPKDTISGQPSSASG